MELAEGLQQEGTMARGTEARGTEARGTEARGTFSGRSPSREVDTDLPFSF